MNHKKSTEPDPEKIREFLLRMTKMFGNEFITIGGWAVSAYNCKGKSLDGDALVSFQTEGCLRDLFLVEKNPRMKKSQMLCEAGCDIDLYVEHQHGLKVPFDEAQAYCQKRKGLFVPCPEHLLILKLEAYKERKNSAKGIKDQEDIIQMLAKLKFQHPDIAEKYLEEDDMEILESICKNVTCSLNISNQNAQAAKKLRSKAKQGLQNLLNKKKQVTREKQTTHPEKNHNPPPNL